MIVDCESKKIGSVKYRLMEEQGKRGGGVDIIDVNKFVSSNTVNYIINQPGKYVQLTAIRHRYICILEHYIQNTLRWNKLETLCKLLIIDEPSRPKCIQRIAISVFQRILNLCYVIEFYLTDHDIFNFRVMWKSDIMDIVMIILKHLLYPLAQNCALNYK